MSWPPEEWERRESEIGQRNNSIFRAFRVWQNKDTGEIIAVLTGARELKLRVVHFSPEEVEMYSSPLKSLVRRKEGAIDITGGQTIYRTEREEQRNGEERGILVVLISRMEPS